MASQAKITKVFQNKETLYFDKSQIQVINKAKKQTTYKNGKQTIKKLKYLEQENNLNNKIV